jgi:hypothetical protein
MFSEPVANAATVKNPDRKGPPSADGFHALMRHILQRSGEHPLHGIPAGVEADLHPPMCSGNSNANGKHTVSNPQP